MPTEATTNDDELLWGAGAIAKAINRDYRATYHLLEQGALSAEKVGGRWVSSRRRLTMGIFKNMSATGA